MYSKQEQHLGAFGVGTFVHPSTCRSVWNVDLCSATQVLVSTVRCRGMATAIGPSGILGSGQSAFPAGIHNL